MVHDSGFMAQTDKQVEVNNLESNNMLPKPINLLFPPKKNQKDFKSELMHRSFMKIQYNRSH